MTQRLNQIGAIVIVAASLWMLWTSLAPNDEKRIRALLRDLGRTVSVEPNQSNLSRLAQGSSLSRLFAEDLQVSLTHPGGEYRGTSRADTIQNIKRLKISPDVKELSVAFKEIDFIDSPSASDERDTTITIVATLNGEDFWMTDRFRFVFRKDEDNSWRIAIIEQYLPGRL